MHREALLPNPTAELSFLRQAIVSMNAALCESIEGPPIPRVALHCLILRPPGDALTTRFWLHWPGLALSNLDLTPRWCERVWGGDALGVL